MGRPPDATAPPEEGGTAKTASSDTGTADVTGPVGQAVATRCGDPRWIAYTRDDGYAEASTVVPDPSRATGWLCPGCKCNTTVFYGLGPQFNKHTRRYERPDTRLCQSCFEQATTEALTS